MKQVVYTCAGCGRQEVVELINDRKDYAPMEWAQIDYRRLTTVEDGKAVGQITCTTHACGDCAKVMLDYIEGTARGEGGDLSAKKEDDVGVLASHAHQLMRVNLQMFEGTVRALAQLNDDLREQIKTLTAENAALRKGA